MTPPDWPTGRYSVIYADPGWAYRDKLANGKRGAAHKYSVMDYRSLARLPVPDIAADDCLLAMWWVPPMPREALFIVEAWGFKLVNMSGFTWEKLTRNGGTAFGLGHWTRGNAESCLFATRGRPKRVDASISQLIRAPARAHAQKPAEARERLERLLGDVPRVELFSRMMVLGLGWDRWGDGVGVAA